MSQFRLFSNFSCVFQKNSSHYLYLKHLHDDNFLIKHLKRIFFIKFLGGEVFKCLMFVQYKSGKVKKSWGGFYFMKSTWRFLGGLFIVIQTKWENIKLYGSTIVKFLILKMRNCYKTNWEYIVTIVLYRSTIQWLITLMSLRVKHFLSKKTS